MRSFSTCLWEETVPVGAAVAVLVVPDLNVHAACLGEQERNGNDF